MAYIMSNVNTIQCFINDADWQVMIKKMEVLRDVYQHKVVRNIARDYVRATAKQTRVAKKLRFRKIINQETKQVYWIPVSPPRRPQGFGFAKLGWFKALSALGVKLKNPNPRVKGYMEAGLYSFMQTDSSETITVGNAVDYITKLDSLDGIDSAGRAYAWTILEKNVRKYEDQLGAIV